MRLGEGAFGFELGAYDQSLALVIDPLLLWSRQLAGSEFDFFSGAAIDEYAFAYAAGFAGSADIITVNALQPVKGAGRSSDAYIVKFGPDGEDILFATFLGGADSDVANGIAVDQFGFIYVTGSTNSADFPTTPGVVQTAGAGDHDIFVVKLSPDGSELVYSTLLGGADREFASKIAVDLDGNVYVGGRAFGPNFPTTPGALQPGFGGGATDGFVFKLNEDATQVLFSTYYGGDGRDDVSDLEIDEDKRTYITGTTASTDLGVTPEAHQAQLGGPSDAYVASLSDSGDALYYASYLGGSGDESGLGLDPDPFGYVWLAGFSRSQDFPATPPHSNALAGGQDGFLARLPLPDALPLALPSAEPSADDTAAVVRLTQRPGNDSNNGVAAVNRGSNHAVAVLNSDEAGTSVGLHDQITGDPREGQLSAISPQAQKGSATIPGLRGVDLAANQAGEASVVGTRRASAVGIGPSQTTDRPSIGLYHIFEELGVVPDMRVAKGFKRKFRVVERTFPLGEPISFEIFVWNRSRSDEALLGVKLVDTSPRGIKINNVRLAQIERRGTKVRDIECEPPRLNKLTCPVDRLAKDERAHIELAIDPPPLDSYTNVVVAEADNVGSREDTVDFSVGIPVNVEIEKQSSITGQPGNRSAESTITVRNVGKTRATGLEVFDSVSIDGIREVSGKTDRADGECYGLLSNLSCRLPALPAGESWEIIVTAPAPATNKGEIPLSGYNLATVSTAEPNISEKTLVQKRFSSEDDGSTQEFSVLRWVLKGFRAVLANDQKSHLVMQAAVCTGVEADIRLDGPSSGENLEFRLDHMGRRMPQTAALPEGCTVEERAIRCPLNNLAETGRQSLEFVLCSGTSPAIFTLQGRVNTDGQDVVPRNDVSTLIVRRDANELPPAVRINRNGITDVAKFGTRGLTPGSDPSLFGVGLAPGVAVAESLPLPLELLGTSVEVNGIPAPLIFVSPNQINFQTTWELITDNVADVVVLSGGEVSDPERVFVVLVDPSIFSLNQTGSGQAAVLIAGTASVPAPTDSIPGARPARIGEFLSIYCIGLGVVDNEPRTGQASPSDPLARTLFSPTVTIGGVDAPVIFSGLAPGFVGLYQVNVQVPEGAPTGDAVDLQMSIGGITSNTVTVAVTN